MDEFQKGFTMRSMCSLIPRYSNLYLDNAFSRMLESIVTIVTTNPKQFGITDRVYLCARKPIYLKSVPYFTVHYFINSNAPGIKMVCVRFNNLDPSEQWAYIEGEIWIVGSFNVKYTISDAKILCKKRQFDTPATRY